ncbi:MAG: sulfur carrier protein ThiS [Burkholderiaceae bacterium]
MHIFVNGAEQMVADAITLAELLETLGLSATSCATAVNGAFVARGDRATCTLCDQDQVMTFEPITGG